MEVTRDEARRFFVLRHWLAPPRALPSSPSSILRVIERFGSLQIDPLATTGAKNQDLVLAARIRDVRPEWIDPFLYGPASSRVLFEAYNKSLNILPIADLPFHRIAWENARARHHARGGVLSKHRAIRARILTRLAREGPLLPGAFATKGDREISWGWGRATATKGVLEALYRTGAIAVASRDGNAKTYHLTEALFPPELLAARVTAEEALTHRILSRYRAVGLLGLSASGEVWMGTDKAPARRRVVTALVDQGVLLPVRIKGVSAVRYILADDRALLKRAARPLPGARAVTLLAPLDPFMWDRRLLRELFDFDYTWEVYTPAHKRVHGYYVLPILFGDELVGRIEPRIERAKAAPPGKVAAGTIVHIDLLRFERTFSPRDYPDFYPALDIAIAAHARLAGAVAVRWKRKIRPNFPEIA